MTDLLRRAFLAGVRYSLSVVKSNSLETIECAFTAFMAGLPATPDATEAVKRALERAAKVAMSHNLSIMSTTSADCRALEISKNLNEIAADPEAVAAIVRGE